MACDSWTRSQLPLERNGLNGKKGITIHSSSQKYLLYGPRIWLNCKIARHPRTQLKSKYKHFRVMLDNSPTIRENNYFIWSFRRKEVKPKHQPMVQPNFDLLQSRTHKSWWNLLYPFILLEGGRPPFTKLFPFS